MARGTTTSGLRISLASVAALSKPTQEKMAKTIGGPMVLNEAPVR
jgi:hypothetical protein